ncbi:hypothetical protein FKM82_009447 [Ascaphus truei]
MGTLSGSICQKGSILPATNCDLSKKRDPTKNNRIFNLAKSGAVFRLGETLINSPHCPMAPFSKTCKQYLSFDNTIDSKRFHH